MPSGTLRPSQWQHHYSAAALLVLSTLLWTFVVCSEPDYSIRPVVKWPTQGGPDEAKFDDIENISSSVFKIHSIGIGSLYQVDFIQVTYKLFNGSLYKCPEHGDGIFTPDVITFAPGEYLVKIEGKTNGQYVNQLSLTTYIPKDDGTIVYGPYGTTKLNATQEFSRVGYIVGLYGTVGKIVLSSIGVYKLSPVSRSPAFGRMSKVTDFADDPDASVPPVVGISKLCVRHGERVYGIWAEYQLHGGERKMGPHHGGEEEGTLTCLTFKQGEILAGVDIKTDDSKPSPLFTQISFLTVRGVQVRRYGPFGTTGVNNFTFYRNIVGLAGTVSDNALDAIQFFYC